METNSFVESLNMILDENKNYYAMIQNTYYIGEASLVDYIKKIDFKKIFKFIFEKFIEIVKTIWNKFKAVYNSFTAKSVLLKRYRKKLENINWDVEIDTYPSTFTNLDSSTNISMYKMSLNEQYGVLVGELEKISNCTSLEDIHATIFNIKNSMDNINDFLDQQRGISIGSRSKVSKEEYPELVAKYFKPDKQALSNVIHPSETKAYTKEYFESKNLEKAITNDQSLLESTANMMINKFNSLDIAKYSPVKEISPEISSMFVNLIREYCNRIQGICNIYVQLFSIKLDMFKLYKEEQVQILSKIILKSMKEGKI